ncbi:hypothetical protein L6452_40869 [Arctium lappa]|uniref:Uncharacterized protein n=1 Tax=Arctium lappa TaxID=4217 RepID=A0ACB8XNK4_ARCLA|nr:hypothetical protein L6452_40869 [Arctium lappa]
MTEAERMSSGFKFIALVFVIVEVLDITAIVNYNIIASQRSTLLTLDHRTLVSFFSYRRTCCSFFSIVRCSPYEPAARSISRPIPLQ